MRRRPFFLLEILVAMALIALCILPLLTIEWSIYDGERLEKTLFLRELEIKNEALLIIKKLYSGEYPLGQLEEGIDLTGQNPDLKGDLIFDENTISIRFMTLNGKPRLFPIAAKKKIGSS